MLKGLYASSDCGQNINLKHYHSHNFRSDQFLKVNYQNNAKNFEQLTLLWLVTLRENDENNFHVGFYIYNSRPYLFLWYFKQPQGYEQEKLLGLIVLSLR